MAFPKSGWIFSTITKGVDIGAQNTTYNLILKLTPTNNVITLFNQQIDMGKFPAEPQNLERIRSLV